MLHALGGSARAWADVIASLGDGFDCVALDLPGFGDHAGEPGITIAEMLDWLAGEIGRRRPSAYLLVGHSMGGKLATLTAARALAGESGLSALCGVVLVAASPPSPEPMAEDRRAEMLGWFDRRQASAAEAETFIGANTAGPLPPDRQASAIADVCRSGRHAWRGWLERGSREDWRDHVDRLPLPAAILAGGEDGDLGEQAQRELNAPFYADATLTVVPGAAHLLPAERPEAVAAAIAGLWRRVRDRALPAAYARLLASPRVSRRTRAALVARVHPHAAETCLGAERLPLLTSMLARLLPHGDPAIDLPAMIDAALAAGEGDGWRPAALPPDIAAWRAGLDTVAACVPAFATLPPAEQDRRLAELIRGEIGGVGAGLFDGARMRLWLEEVRAAAVRAWLSHPAAMARIGYDGFANGGDGPRLEGYARLGADDLDPWQPRPAGACG